MKIDKLLKAPSVKWLSGEGNDTDVVLSSRVRLARNLQGVLFPNRGTNEELLQVLRDIEGCRGTLDSLGNGKYSVFKMDSLTDNQQKMLVEKHLVSKHLADNGIGKGFLIREDESVVVMINEEDHLRIQGMSRGLHLDGAFKNASEVDDEIGQRLTFAFQGDLGFLTACPTNVGTGMRASVMLHLPALTLNKQMNQLRTAIQPHGMVLRGLDGEGSDASGHIYQLSNQVTLGISEEGILNKLELVTKQVADFERKAREEIQLDTLADQSGRAYGILKYAHKISTEEALNLMSLVRLGRFRNTLPTGKENWFERLLVSIRPHFLQSLETTKILSPLERDQLRANILRKKIDG